MVIMRIETLEWSQVTVRGDPPKIKASVPSRLLPPLFREFMSFPSVNRSIIFFIFNNTTRERSGCAC